MIEYLMKRPREGRVRTYFEKEEGLLESLQNCPNCLVELHRTFQISLSVLSVQSNVFKPSGHRRGKWNR